MKRWHFYLGAAVLAPLALFGAKRKIPKVGEGQVIPKGLSYALSDNLRLYVHVGDRMVRVRLAKKWPWIALRYGNLEALPK